MKHALKDYAVAPAPTFGLPPDEERMSLRVGKYAKVVFALDVVHTLDEDPEMPPPDGERMWIMVTEVLRAGEYRGRLDNTPLFADVSRGATVDFSWRNVISIMED